MPFRIVDQAVAAPELTSGVPGETASGTGRPPESFAVMVSVADPPGTIVAELNATVTVTTSPETLKLNGAAAMVPAAFLTVMAVVPAVARVGVVMIWTSQSLA